MADTDVMIDGDQHSTPFIRVGTTYCNHSRTVRKVSNGYAGKRIPSVLILVKNICGRYPATMVSVPFLCISATAETSMVSITSMSQFRMSRQWARGRIFRCLLSIYSANSTNMDLTTSSCYIFDRHRSCQSFFWYRRNGIPERLPS